MACLKKGKTGVSAFECASDGPDLKHTDTQTFDYICDYINIYVCVCDICIDTRFKIYFSLHGFLIIVLVPMYGPNKTQQKLLKQTCIHRMHHTQV